MAGIDIYTGLCLHCEGANNGSVFTDSSYVAPKAMSRSGDAVTKTDVFKFGTSSVYFDGIGDYLSTADHVNWYFGIQDFTIDCWIKVSSTSADYVICSQISTDTLKWMFYVSSQTLAFIAYISTGVKSVDIKGTGTQLNDNAWHHVAVVRNGLGANSCKLYIDGSAIAVTTTVDLANRYMPDQTNSLDIGRQNNPTSKYFVGYIDEFRISKGIARWTSNFTPPTEAYSRSGIYYIHPETGLDINDGESWATAWRSIKSGASAARLLAGDIIRIAKSSDPTSIGIASWVKQNKTVTLTTPTSKGIDFCETAWMAAANVTVTADATDYKHGTKSAKFVPAAAFLTGKMGWKQIAPTTDYSAYTGVSFWFKASVLPVVGVYKLCLCSDISGETIVNTINIPSFPTAANPYWGAVAVDTGAPLGNSIRSVSLHAISDPGSPSLFLDDIIAFASGELHLKHLISKTPLASQGTEPWWGIQSISGEVVNLDNSVVTLGNAGSGYYGTTESVQSYKRLPFSLSSGEDCYIQDSGSDGSLIAFQGGYDPSNNIQNGETFFDGVCSPSIILYYNAKDYVSCSRISVCRGQTGVSMLTGIDCRYDGNNCSNCHGSNFDTGSGYRRTINLMNAVNVNQSYTGVSIGGGQLGCEVYLGKIYGGNALLGSDAINEQVEFGEIANGAIGISFGNGYGSVFKGGAIRHCTSFGLSVNYDADGDRFFHDFVFSNNAVNVNGTITQSNAFLYRPTFVDGTIVDSITYQAAFIKMIGVNGNPQDNRCYYREANMISQTVVRHTAEGVAWKLSVTGSTNNSVLNPIRTKLGRVMVFGGATTTISCYMRRTNTGLTTGLFIRRRQLRGMESNVTTWMTANADTWELVSAQITPSESGVVEFEVLAYGGTTYSVYIDDVIISRT